MKKFLSLLAIMAFVSSLGMSSKAHATVIETFYEEACNVNYDMFSISFYPSTKKVERLMSVQVHKKCAELGKTAKIEDVEVISVQKTPGSGMYCKKVEFVVEYECL